MNRRLIQRQLDLSAEELDRKGYKDLSDRIDRFNEQIEKASSQQRKIIARSLQAIDREVERRDGVDYDSSDNKRAALRRKLALRRRMRQRAEKRTTEKQDMRSTQDRRERRQERLANRKEPDIKTKLARRRAAYRAARDE